MEYYIGYFATPFVLAFLVVNFGMKKGYEKKHGSPMSNGQVAARTIGIGLIFLCLTLFGAMS